MNLIKNVVLAIGLFIASIAYGNMTLKLTNGELLTLGAGDTFKIDTADINKLTNTSYITFGGETRTNWPSDNPNSFYVSTVGNDTAAGTNWSTALATVSNALDKSSDGNIIYVTNGTYTLSTPILLNKAVTIEGMNRDAVIFDGGGVTQCVIITASGSVLKNVTISNGYSYATDGIYLSSWPTWGGGINATNGTIDNCVIKNCSCYVGGGASLLWDANVINTLFVDNRAVNTNNYAVTTNTWGGGLHAYNCLGIISNCVFSNNIAGYYGGGAYVRNSKGVNNCTFNNNKCYSATGLGGGLLMDGVTNLVPFTRNCSFNYNVASNYAGGAVMYGGAQIFDSTFYGNSAKHAGGLYLKASYNLPQITNYADRCTIVSNIASGNAGGVYIAYGNGEIRNSLIASNLASSGAGITIYNSNLYTVIRNCTIVGNTATNLGGGIKFTNTLAAAKSLVYNCIVYSNTCTPNSTYDNWYIFDTNRTIVSNTCTLPSISDFGGNNITNPPVFMGNGDYSLQKTSPCIDTGIQEDWISLGLDLLGNKRFWNKAVDMGAYEYVEETDPYFRSLSTTLVYTVDSRLTDARTPLTHNQDWTTITSTPTTLGGYAITDAVTNNDSRLTDARTPTAHDQTWGTITNTPTTIAGYGITDSVSGTNWSKYKALQGVDMGRNPITNASGFEIYGTNNSALSGYDIHEDNLITADGVSDGTKGFLWKDNGISKWAHITYPNEHGEYIYLFANQSTEIPITVNQGSRIAINKQANILNYHALWMNSTTGISSADDISVGGVYNKTQLRKYEVKIASDGPTNTWKYRSSLDNGITWSDYSASNNCTTTETAIEFGITIAFDSITGHSTADAWQFNAFPQLPMGTFTVAAPMFVEVITTTNNDSETPTWYDVTYNAGVSDGNPISTLSTTNCATYIGRRVPFNSCYVYVISPAVNVTLVSEFWNGSAWQPLSTTSNYYSDGTANLTVSGKRYWDKSTFTNWTKWIPTGKDTNGYNLYWMRFRTTTEPTAAALVGFISPQNEKRFAIYSAYLDALPSFYVDIFGRTYMNKAYRGSTATTFEPTELVTDQHLQNNLANLRAVTKYLGINSINATVGSTAVKTNIMNSYGTTNMLLISYTGTFDIGSAVLPSGSKFVAQLFANIDANNRTLYQSMKMYEIGTVTNLLATSAQIGTFYNRALHDHILTTTNATTGVSSNKFKLELWTQKTTTDNYNLFTYYGSSYPSVLNYPLSGITGETDPVAVPRIDALEATRFRLTGESNINIRTSGTTSFVGFVASGSKTMTNTIVIGADTNTWIFINGQLSSFKVNNIEQ